MPATAINLGTDIRDRIQEELRGVRFLLHSHDYSIELKVHEIRKSIKRMRSLLRLLKNSYLPKHFYALDTLMGNAGNSLSTIRDATVNYEMFVSLIENNPNILSGSRLQSIKSSLANRAKDAYQEQEQLQTCQLYLTQVGHALQYTPFEDFGYRNLLNRLDKAWIKAGNSYRNARYTLDTEILHKWRRHAKYVFLQLKFAPALQDLDLDSVKSTLHLLTDVLGKEHDLFLLEEVLIKLMNLSPEERQRIHGMISKTRSFCQKRAFNLAESVFSIENIPSSRLVLPV